MTNKHKEVLNKAVELLSGKSKYQETFKTCKKAAEQGHADAKTKLTEIHSKK
ncbi:MAG: hypothetical protein LE168_04585 [Endomicrobium sp.]|nr:hypothetical protein [Endomicrobium sp.]